MTTKKKNATQGNDFPFAQHTQTIATLKNQVGILEEKLNHVKITADVFMHYLCTVGKDCEFSPMQLDQINVTFLNCLHRE